MQPAAWRHAAATAAATAAAAAEAAGEAAGGGVAVARCRDSCRRIYPPGKLGPLTQLPAREPALFEHEQAGEATLRAVDFLLDAAGANARERLHCQQYMKGVAQHCRTDYYSARCPARRACRHGRAACSGFLSKRQQRRPVAEASPRCLSGKLPRQLVQQQATRRRRSRQRQQLRQQRQLPATAAANTVRKPSAVAKGKPTPRVQRSPATEATRAACGNAGAADPAGQRRQQSRRSTLQAMVLRSSSQRRRSDWWTVGRSMRSALRRFPIRPARQAPATPRSAPARAAASIAKAPAVTRRRSEPAPVALAAAKADAMVAPILPTSLAASQQGRHRWVLCACHQPLQQSGRGRSGSRGSSCCGLFEGP